MKQMGKSETMNSDLEIPSNSKTGSLPSEVQVKTPGINHASQSWLAITLGLIAVAGIVGTVGVTVVAAVVLNQAKTTATTPTSTTSKLFSFLIDHFLFI
jgi:hypothetical protein